MEKEISIAEARDLFANDQDWMYIGAPEITYWNRRTFAVLTYVVDKVERCMLLRTPNTHES